MDFSKVIWRDGAEMLKSTQPFVRDAAFDYDAPTWCDLHQASQREEGNLALELAAAEWFSQPHPLHRPLIPTPPAQLLIDPREYSPYKSPIQPQAPSTATWSKVSPGHALGSAMRMSASKSNVMRTSMSARKVKKVTSPIAIHSMIHTTPHKTVGTPLKLIDSTGKSLLNSASKLTGAQRVVQKMQFDAIDESTPMLISPDHKPRAARVSTVPNISLFSSSQYKSHVTDENAPPNQPTQPVTAATKKPVRRVVTKSTVTAPPSTALQASSQPTTRKRRSAEVNSAPTLDALDPELEAMLSKHNQQIAAERAQDQALAQHNRALHQSTHPHHKSPLANNHSKKVTSPVAPPGSGNKAPKKKMRFVPCKTNSGLADPPPPLNASTSLSRVNSKKSLNRSTRSSQGDALSSGSLRKSIASTNTSIFTDANISPRSPLSPYSRSVSRNTRSSTTRSSAENSFYITDHEQDAQPADEVSHEPSQLLDQDISFSVEDLGLPIPIPTEEPLANSFQPASSITTLPQQSNPPLAIRKSLGKALRRSITDIDEDAEMTPTIPPPTMPTSIDSVDAMLDEAIVLDEVKPPSKRIQAQVKFTAAVKPTTTAVKPLATSMQSTNVRNNKAVTNGVLAKPSKPALVTKAPPSTKSTVAPPLKKPSIPVTTAAPIKTTRPKSAAQTSDIILGAASLLREDDEIAELLRSHNNQFKPKVRYVPRQYSTQQIKAWEAQVNKKWYELSADERELANIQIGRMIQT